MLDVLNEQLVQQGEEPVAFDHDCREGICGSCGMMINGQAHGPERKTTACQLHMRKFRNNDTIVIEPWRAEGFPVVKDLAVDRSSFDRIVAAGGGYVSVNVGNAPDGNAIPVPKANADKAFEAATCIGCGACVAACKNASAMLFVSARFRNSRCSPRGLPNANAVSSRWWPEWTRKASAAVPTRTSAKPPAPSVSRSTTSPASTENTSAPPSPRSDGVCRVPLLARPAVRTSDSIRATSRPR